MTPKQKDMYVTAIIVAIVIAIMAAIVWMIVVYNNGGMEVETVMILSTFLSSTMFLVVIIYALIIQRTNERARRERKIEELQKKE
jgi:hypothetical protein